MRVTSGGRGAAAALGCDFDCDCARRKTTKWKMATDGEVTPLPLRKPR